MNKPSVIYDTLFIGVHLEKKMEDFSLSEIQFFSYLSCLLCLYDGKTIDEWSYKFIKSNLGSPYSSDIHLAVDALLANETIIPSEGTSGYYKISKKGFETLKFYQTLSTLSWRSNYLETSCNSLSLIPFSSIKEAIANEPVLNSANNSLTKRSLLEETNPATQSLHIQFASLKTAIENQDVDLIIPAVVWIASLIQNKK